MADETPAVDPSWAANGFNDNEARRWIAHDFTAQEAALWVAVHGDPVYGLGEAVRLRAAHRETVDRG